jgi:hypothetical protein
VALEDEQLLAGVGVPQPQRLVIAAGQQELAVGRDADVQHPTRVAGQAELLVTELHPDSGAYGLGAAAHFWIAARSCLIQRLD